MPTLTDDSANQKSAYQRPYRTRSQRREVARRKHDENADQKFLIRVALVAGLLLLVAVGIALKGVFETNAPAAPASTEAGR